MVIVTVAVSSPALLRARMVYDVPVTSVTFGVPLIAPVKGSRERPSGKAGSMLQTLTTPSVDVMVIGVIASVRVAVIDATEMLITGGISPTVKVRS